MRSYKTWGLVMAVALAACGLVYGIDGFQENLQPYGTYYVHDPARPQPLVVTPGEPASPLPTTPPSDATVLFGGWDLDAWVGDNGAPTWRIEDGALVAVPGEGGIRTKERFGDIQLHLEWSAPNPPVGTGQDRGNSGVIIMNRYEIQILDNYNAQSYADGTAGALYGQWPPLVNALRPPGEWNTYDIIFTGPRWTDGELTRPAHATVLVNGVVVHNHQALLGAVAWRQVAQYSPHPETETLSLQEHGHPVRFRNIWVRNIGEYDTGEPAPATP
ncbi:MAG TPA: DUF1080 domain-containing protein [Armatimonadetes bacterium]|nr:DUF1080 domain-containing protein [Armatimonadota bacterium]